LSRGGPSQAVQRPEGLSSRTDTGDSKRSEESADRPVREGAGNPDLVQIEEFCPAATDDLLGRACVAFALNPRQDSRPDLRAYPKRGMEYLEMIRKGAAIENWLCGWIRQPLPLLV